MGTSPENILRGSPGRFILNVLLFYYKKFMGTVSYIHRQKLGTGGSVLVEGQFFLEFGCQRHTTVPIQIFPNFETADSSGETVYRSPLLYKTEKNRIFALFQNILL